MNKKRWIKKLTEQTKAVGTYQEAFNSVIAATAEILEQRDLVYEAYLASGAEPLVKKVSDRGAENMGKNPMLTTWESLNKTALSYLSSLGLTPAGLKKINEISLKKEEGSALEKALSKIGGSG